MPFTLAHPAAVLPLRRFCPDYAIFAALIAGSMAPDLPYFIFRWGAGGYAHTFPGIIFLSIPMGVVLFLLFLYFVPKGAKLLSAYHRQFVQSWFAQRPPMSFRYSLLVISSVFIGAITHVLWDSFTHSTGWSVAEIPYLRTELAHVGHWHIHLYTLLQHGSTALGFLLISWAYMRNYYHYWTENKKPESRPFPLLIWATIILLPLLVTMVIVMPDIQVTNIQIQLGRIVILYVDFAVLLISIAAIGIKDPGSNTNSSR